MVENEIDVALFRCRTLPPSICSSCSILEIGDVKKRGGLRGSRRVNVICSWSIEVKIYLTLLTLVVGLCTDPLKHSSQSRSAPTFHPASVA
jgi:hypothetical protein